MIAVNMAHNTLLVICFLCIGLIQATIALPPKLIPFNDHIDLVENLTYPLTCTILSGSHISFEWTHNDTKLTNSADVQLENTPTFSFLTLRNIKRHHSGVYACRATNLAGESDQTQTQINVQGNCLLFCVKRVRI